MTLVDLPSLPAVQELLRQEASALRVRWEASSAEELEAAIAQYKAALAQVLDEFKRLGERRGRHQF